MKKASFYSMVCVMLVLSAGARATTNFWITNEPNGTPLPIDSVSGNPELKVNFNQPITIYTFFSTTNAGNGFEMLLGYDKSDAIRLGVGYDTNNGAYKKLVLTSTETEIANSINPIFNYEHLAHIDASAKEPNNPWIGGRPYGVSITGIATAIKTYGATRIATLKFNHNLAVGESAYFVISKSVTASSYSTYWIGSGGICYQDDYALKVTAVPEPVTAILLCLGGLGLLRRSNIKSIKG
jgi:hypothetical protein